MQFTIKIISNKFEFHCAIPLELQSLCNHNKLSCPLLKNSSCLTITLHTIYPYVVEDTMNQLII